MSDSIDSLLINALNSGGKLLGGERVFALEYNLELELYHIKSLKDLYKDNMFSFLEGHTTGWNTLGIFSKESEAERFRDTLQKGIKHFEGDILRSDDYHVLVCHPVANELMVFNLNKFFDDNYAAYSIKITRPFLILGIYSDKETAEENVTYVRMLFRDEAGTNLIRKRLEGE